MPEVLRTGDLLTADAGTSLSGYTTEGREGVGYVALLASATYGASDIGRDGCTFVFGGSVPAEYLLRAYRYLRSPPDFEEWIGAATSANPSGEPIRDKTIITQIARS